MDYNNPLFPRLRDLARQLEGVVPHIYEVPSHVTRPLADIAADVDGLSKQIWAKQQELEQLAGVRFKVEVLADPYSTGYLDVIYTPVGADE
ncbi:hypothetical protein [Burkholderia pseudomallei]|uniref:hypothetical protein n=1 Tax=Burkholderia pseudomallei TaxID=28450 RepID=UPI00193CB854|nr:hypothetical protein [Burkholderia pseudomallei]QRM23539.1 hypothetical protein JQX71_04440 [Burkholderia pseudomallei]